MSYSTCRYKILNLDRTYHLWLFKGGSRLCFFGKGFFLVGGQFLYSVKLVFSCLCFKCPLNHYSPNVINIFFQIMHFENGFGMLYVITTVWDDWFSSFYRWSTCFCVLENISLSVWFFILDVTDAQFSFYLSVPISLTVCLYIFFPWLSWMNYWHVPCPRFTKYIFLVSLIFFVCFIISVYQVHQCLFSSNGMQLRACYILCRLPSSFWLETPHALVLFPNLFFPCSYIWPSDARWCPQFTHSQHDTHICSWEGFYFKFMWNALWPESDWNQFGLNCCCICFWFYSKRFLHCGHCFHFTWQLALCKYSEVLLYTKRNVK